MKKGVKMKKYFVLVFFILIIFLAGCSKSPTTPPTATFKGGIEGLGVSFVNLAPPTEFSQSSLVKAKVLIKNKGETRVETGNARVKLFGVTLENFGLQNVYKSNLAPIEGKGELTADGGEQEVELGQIKYNKQIINQESFTLLAKLCYPYQTIAKTDVCLQSLLTKESGGSVCDIAGEKITSGSVSGAPIQVTSITEQTRGEDQIRFDIKIENKGKGKVYLAGSKCEDLDKDDLRFENKNKIKVKIESPLNVICGFRSGQQGNEGIVVLDDKNVATLSCWKNVEDPVVDKLHLKLDYVYLEQTSKDIRILQSRK